MKSKPLKTFLFSSVLTILLPALAIGQSRRDTISLYHKTEIIALFKSIDPNKYRLEFNYVGEIYGLRTLNSSELQEKNKTERLLGESFVLNVPNATIIQLTSQCLLYGYAPSRTDPYAMRRLLGPEKIEKLKSHVSFYIPNAKL